jgi:hypothetical protein
VQVLGDFVRHGVEELRRVDPAGHQSGHPPKRGLLLGELTELLAAGPQFASPIGAGRMRHREACDKLRQ